MGQIFATFGIDWRLLLIDLVNFGLLMLALWYFLYEPLTNILDQRREKVAQGVRDAEAAGKKLHEVESDRSAMLADAGRQADEVLERARKAGADKERELAAAGEAAAARMLTEARAQALQLKEEARQESKREAAKLIVLGVEKALQAK